MKTGRAILSVVISAAFFAALFLAIETISGMQDLRAAPEPQYITQNPFWRYLDTTGDGSGTKVATGTYTSTIFSLQPPAGSVFVVSRLIVQVEDSDIVTASLYGAATITNGVAIRKQDDSGTDIDLTDGLSITANIQWSRICEVDIAAFTSGDDRLQAICDLERAGSLLRLNGDQNERLEVVLGDDFSGLSGHYFLAQGFVE